MVELWAGAQFHDVAVRVLDENLDSSVGPLLGIGHDWQAELFDDFGGGFRVVDSKGHVVVARVGSDGLVRVAWRGRIVRWIRSGGSE